MRLRPIGARASVAVALPMMIDGARPVAEQSPHCPLGRQLYWLRAVTLRLRRRRCPSTGGTRKAIGRRAGHLAT